MLEEKLELERLIVQSGGGQGCWVGSTLSRVKYVWASASQTLDVDEHSFPGMCGFTGGAGGVRYTCTTGTNPCDFLNHIFKGLRGVGTYVVRVFPQSDVTPQAGTHLCASILLPCIEGVHKKHMETVENHQTPLPPYTWCDSTLDCFPFHSKGGLQE